MRVRYIVLSAGLLLLVMVSPVATERAPALGSKVYTEAVRKEGNKVVPSKSGEKLEADEENRLSKILAEIAASINFLQFVNSADLIAVVSPIEIKEPPTSSYKTDITSIAHLHIKEIIKGTPVGNPIRTAFIAGFPERQFAVFELNKEYLVFMESRSGESDVYNLVARRVWGDLGLVKIENNIAIARVYPEGIETPMLLEDYKSAIKKVLREEPPNLKNRVDKFIDGLRNGLFVDGDRSYLTLSLWFHDSGEPMDDLRDIIHDKTVAYLKPYINDDDVHVRRGVYELLKQIGSDEATPLFVKGLNDTDIHVKRRCIEGLVRVQAWSAVPALIDSFSKEITQEDINKLNTDTGQAITAIILQHRYKQWGNIKWPSIRKVVFEKDNLPSYLSRASSEKGLQAIQKWNEWLEERKNEFK